MIKQPEELMEWIRVVLQEPDFALLGKLHWTFGEGKGDLFQFSGEFELSEFESIEKNQLKSEVKSKGYGT